MKKIAYLGIMFFIIINLSSCQKAKKQIDNIQNLPDEVISLEQTSEPEDVNSEDTEKALIEKYAYLGSIDVSIEKGNNYEIFTDKDHTGYRCVVRNNDGSIIDECYHNYRGGISFEIKDDILILNQGFGGSVFYERYYDVSNGRISRFYEMPLDSSEELVAYCKHMGDENTLTLVVQNMFDPSIYYKEITGDFSVLEIYVTIKGEFIEDGSKIKLTYWLCEGNEEVTEIIYLTSH